MTTYATCLCTGRCKSPPYTCSGEPAYTAPPFVIAEAVGWYCPGCRAYHAPTITTCPQNTDIPPVTIT